MSTGGLAAGALEASDIGSKRKVRRVSEREGMRQGDFVKFFTSVLEALKILAVPPSARLDTKMAISSILPDALSSADRKTGFTPWNRDSAFVLHGDNSLSVKSVQ